MAPPTLEAAVLLHFIPEGEGCWPWQGNLRNGYGRLVWRKRHYYAHRAVYEAFVGPIPEGFTIDHTCHNDDPTCPGGRMCLHRRCVRLDHLEPTTVVENHNRGTLGARAGTCSKGHPLVKGNLYVVSGRAPFCRTCHLHRQARYDRAHKEEVLLRGA